MDTFTLTELEIERLCRIMEEMANTPIKDPGKRQPGEKCMYEIQRKEKHGC